MLRLHTGIARDCEGLSRRKFLQIGGLSALGLTLPDLLRARAANSRTATNCILLWMQGGPSHIDMFDPKPDAPAEVRGEFGVIDTCIPGVKVTEHLPRLAQQLDKFSIIRGGNPQNGSHGVADHLMMSGHKFNPSIPFPCYGSVISKERGYKNGMLPFVQLGRNVDQRFNGGIGGFLGDQFNPVAVGDDPAQANFRVRDLSLSSGADASRLERRHNMLTELEHYQRDVEAEASGSVQARDVFYEKAFGLITSPIAKRAFDLNQEPDKLRE